MPRATSDLRYCLYKPADRVNGNVVGDAVTILESDEYHEIVTRAVSYGPGFPLAVLDRRDDVTFGLPQGYVGKVYRMSGDWDEGRYPLFHWKPAAIREWSPGWFKAQEGAAIKKAAAHYANLRKTKQ